MSDYSVPANASLVLPTGAEGSYDDQAAVTEQGWSHDPAKAVDILENQLHCTKGADGIHSLPDGTRLGPWPAITPTGWSDWNTALEIVAKSCKTTFSNFTRFSHPDVPGLLDAVGAATSDVELKTSYGKLDRIYRARMPRPGGAVPPSAGSSGSSGSAPEAATRLAAGSRPRVSSGCCGPALGVRQDRGMTMIGLADGRSLDVQISGPADGPVLVFHHGTPGSAPQLRLMQRESAARGLRLLTWSRPGYGASTRRPARRVVDVVPDVAAVLDHLGVERCLVAGWSGGGPHALATAVGLPARVAGVLSLAGVGPYGADDLNFLAGMGEDNLVEFGLALQGEDALRPWLEQEAVGLGRATAAEMVTGMSSLLPEVDRAVLGDEFGEDLTVSFREALRTGVDGWADDDLAFVRPWGFALSDLTTPAYLWQGSADLMVPFAHGRWLAGQLPGATVHLEQGEGHLSVLVGRLSQALDELVTAW